MPGRDLRGAQPIGEGEELAHLDRAVARDARARRRPAQVGVDERVDHFFREELAAIERIVRDAEVVGDAARVVLVFGRAAPAAHRAVVGVVPEVQGDADHVVPALDEPRRGHGGVDPSAHGHDDALA